MLKSLLNFIGGKDADIFNKKGRVQHQLTQDKWDAWKNRLSKNPQYDWKHHAGKDGPDHPIEKSTKPSK